MGTRIRIQKGFVRPPVRYSKEISWKRSNNRQIVISLKFRVLVTGYLKVKKIFNNNKIKIKDIVAQRLNSTSISEYETKTAKD